MMLPNLAAPVQRGMARTHTASQKESQASIKPSWFYDWTCDSTTSCAYGSDTYLSASFGCYDSEGHCHRRRGWK